ncbi:tetratricopeptide repeat protein [Marinicella litoralis]|uniref:Tetratricopeptide repeat protein n=1 Tax=Marinicella litoralis TaxID=644220 RepID=A0A4R6XQG6_9GAMM|nr:tetratricopeptide repeat protein [Marinicella litoralis]TDR20450.1 tetratricopeptide repeat protein [Marinicella litoralis]
MSQIENIKVLHNQGQFEQAIEGYQELLKNEPNNDEAHFGIAHASSRINDIEQALVHAKEAVKLVPNSDRYQQFKGQMLLANREIDAALSSFKRSIKENPNLFHSYLAIGDIYAIKNESKKAKDHYKLALKVESNGIPAIIKLSKLLLLEGDYQGAAKELQQAELQFPNDPNLKLQLGIMRLERGEDGFAELYFSKLLEDEPNHAVAKTYLSISLLNSDPDRASKIIAELVDQQVQIPELMAALGLFYAKNNRYQDAIQYLTPICQSGLAYPSWLMALAESFAANLQPNSAMKVLSEVLQRGDNPKALIILGQIHQINDNYQLAIKTYQRIKPGEKEFNQALLRQAECLYKSRDFEAAIKKLDELLGEKNDHNAGIKLKLNALSKLNRFDDALALIESIDASKQGKEFNQLMHFFAGLLLDEQQKYDQAWDHFSALEHKQPHEVQMLSAADEKAVQSFSSEPANSVFRFVFTDPATGHHDFLQWLQDNNITPLIDRFTAKARTDVFAQQWTVSMLQEITEAQAHLWRKKYTKQLNLVISDNTDVVMDFIPFSPINVAVIKKIFPKAHVLILSRNFADMRLHNQVFGTYQLHYTQISKATNQMVAMNPNVAVVDIDEWQNKQVNACESIEKIFGSQTSDFKLLDVKPLDRMIMPFMHWKNYQQHLSQKPQSD